MVFGCILQYVLLAVFTEDRVERGFFVVRKGYIGVLGMIFRKAISIDVLLCDPAAAIIDFLRELVLDRFLGRFLVGRVSLLRAGTGAKESFGTDIGTCYSC